MSEKARCIDLSDELLKKIAGGRSDEDDYFSFSCFECGTTITVSPTTMDTRCPKCGEEYTFLIPGNL